MVLLCKQELSQDFSKGGGGLSHGVSEDTQQIVMSFSPAVVGYLLKKGGAWAPPW